MKFTKQYLYTKIRGYFKFNLKKKVIKSKLYTTNYGFCVTKYLWKNLLVRKSFMSNLIYHQHLLIPILHETVNYQLSKEGTLKIVQSIITWSQNPKQQQLIVVQETILILQRKQRETTESEKATNTLNAQPIRKSIKY